MKIPRWLRRRADRTLVDTSAEHPVIYTSNPGGGIGVVPEWARRAAAENMRDDPEKMAYAIKVLGEAEARRRYPEAFKEDSDDKV
jgi:hypothetical protein